MLRKFTTEELAEYNGKNNKPAYIAAFDLVYDVTNSFLWQQGQHQVIHFAGKDLTESLKLAPHGLDVFKKFQVVGRLIKI